MKFQKKLVVVHLILFLLLIANSFSFADEYIVPKKPASVDVADIDFDGDLDIVLGHHYFNNWTGVSVLSNDGYGNFTFRDSTYYGGSHSSLHLLDLDENNSYDIVTEYYDDVEETGMSIIFNFNDIAVTENYFLDSGAGNFKIGDIDSDSDLDVIFYCNPFFFWGYMKNNGNGEFSEPVYFDLDYPPQGIAIGDLNGDSRQDILIGGRLDSWLNLETGLQYYSIPDTANASSTIEIADIDNDGDQDIIGVNWGMPGSPKKFVIYTNDGVGNFEQTYTRWIDEALAEMFVADLNNDNYPDVVYNVSIYYPNSEEEIFNTYILFNNQDGTFQDPVNYYTGICSHVSYAADLDGNGWKDIITLNYDFYNPPPTQGTIHILFQDSIGNFVEESQTSIETQNIATSFELYQNYPNPFNPVTNIEFSLQKKSPVTLSIFNSKGELVKTLYDSKNKGFHSITFDASNLNSGIYFYKLTTENNSETRKMLFLK